MPVPPISCGGRSKAVLDDIGADAIKTGMLVDAGVIEAVADALERGATGVPLVVDPVMVAKGGARVARCATPSTP